MRKDCSRSPAGMRLQPVVYVLLTTHPTRIVDLWSGWYIIQLAIGRDRLHVVMQCLPESILNDWRLGPSLKALQAFAIEFIASNQCTAATLWQKPGPIS